jgi:Protein of unknown function DUF2834
MMNATGRGTTSEWLYVALGLLGLVGSWAQGWSYLGAGLLEGNVLFWRDAVANPAGTFLTVDILALGAALIAWMFAEGRRLGIGSSWLWGYLLLSVLVAISFALPMFLAHRHRRRRLVHPEQIGKPATVDWIGIGLVAAVAVVAAIYSLRHAA